MKTKIQKNPQILANKNYFKKNLRYSQFIRLFFLTMSTPLLLLAAFNLIINPYDVFNVPTIDKINSYKYKKTSNMRLFKTIDIIRIKPKTIFLGSSRTDYGLEPNHEALKDKQPAYNLGLGSSTPYELLQYLKHTIANQPELELVIIGLDEFMFNPFNPKAQDFDQQRLEKIFLTPKDTLNSLISLDAFVASKDTIYFSLKYPEHISYTPQGRLNLRPVDKKDSLTNYRFSRNIGIYFKFFHQKYNVSQEQLESLQEILNLCRKNNINVKVFISPSHATRYETIRIAGHWEEYEKMKRELVKIIPIWDFSGYNSITTEPISNNMKNYIDDSHYRKEVGDLVINRLLNYQLENVPKDFGILITPENIESHLKKIREDREIWARENLEEVKLVQKIKSKQNLKLD